MKKLVIILPAYNEAKVISQVLKDLKKNTQTLPVKTQIIVVNDGSTDQTAALAKKQSVLVLTHLLNRGYGAALQTGIEYARRIKADYAVTFDADGQHYPQDITKILTNLNQGFDIVIGSRFLLKNKIPFLRRIILKIANLTTFIFFGTWVSDSQSGFRGFSHKALTKIKLSANRMEVSSELYGELKKHQLSYSEVPISVRYTSYSLSKGQQNFNSLNILLKLIYKLFR